jgi:hypothetical protein
MPPYRVGVSDHVGKTRTVQINVLNQDRIEEALRLMNLGVP